MTRSYVTDEGEKKGDYCDHCKMGFSTSTAGARGFVLCKVCREVEEEIYKLGEQRYQLSRELFAARANYQKKPSLCMVRKVVTLRRVMEEVETRLKEELSNWDKLRDSCLP